MTETAKPIFPAATILILRDSEHGMESLMVRRHHKIDFASGAYVYPGGKVDAGDAAEALADFIPDPDAHDDTHRAARIGAIRETFEESGILLARNKGESDLVSAEQVLSLQKYRDELHKNRMSLLELVQQENLQLATDLLVHFAHWIGPEHAPKRFDTQFYMVEAPADQLAVHDGHESVDSVWITPQQALKDADEGRYTIIFPTRMNVAKLARHTRTADALEAARTSTVVTVLPVVKKVGGEPTLCIPAEADYDLTEVPLSQIRGG
ncbi:MAG TPA: NUDIX hydrolase [Gammaproteobacteria bacterium]|nr:NUDIX hydrolase [Gammaproteobacteria bacterium]